MPDIYDWSVTAADNDDADSGINWLEGQLPGTVNGSSRTMMKRVADWLDDYGAVGTVAGTADAITLTSAIASLASGKRVAFKAGADNTGAATIAVNGLTAKAIRKMVGGTDAALAAGDIKQGVRYDLIYDSTANAAAGAWILLVHTRLVFPATITPQASDGAALGTSSLPWSDVHLASGGVLNFNNGDATITHSADTLTLSAGNAPTNQTAVILNNDGVSMSHNVGTGVLVADSDFSPLTAATMGLGTPSVPWVSLRLSNLLVLYDASGAPSYPVTEGHIYHTAASGTIITGEGSTSDILIANKAGNTALRVLTGTVDVQALGNLAAAATTALPAGGSTVARATISSTAGFGVYVGSGAPTVSAAKGSLYLRSDGSGTGDRLYVNTNGTTGWTAITTAT